MLSKSLPPEIVRILLRFSRTCPDSPDVQRVYYWTLDLKITWACGESSDFLFTKLPLFARRDPRRPPSRNDVDE